jgi:Ca2+-transporting ATPase
LTSAEAASRLAAEGANELAHEGRREVWNIAFEVLREPVLLMLLAAGAIYVSLGDLEEALGMAGGSAFPAAKSFAATSCY